MTNEEAFKALQVRWLEVGGREHEYRLRTLLHKYGQAQPPSAWLTKTELAQLVKFSDAKHKAVNRMIDLLDRIGCRDWCVGVPAHWLMAGLTFEDATTRGELAVMPPTAFGSTPADMRRFSAAVAS